MSSSPPQGASLPQPRKLSQTKLLGRLGLCWLAMAWLVTETKSYWNNRPDLQFGWIVLVLSAYLVWEAWLTRPVVRLQWRWTALLMAGTGLGFMFLFQIYRMAFGTTPAALYFLAAGVMLMVCANLHYAFGTEGVRRFAFAFGFILVALPLPSVIYFPVVTGLQAKVAAINVGLLNIAGIPAQQIGSLIRLPNGTVGVDEACSGIRSLQATVMATLFVGYLTLNRGLLQVVLLGAGALLAIVGNIIRSLFLTLVANSRGISAVNSFHDTAGWSVLAFTAIGIILISYGLARLEKMATAPEPALPDKEIKAAS